MTDAAHHARRSRKLMGVVLAAVVALVVPLTVVSSAQGAPGGGGGRPDAGGGSTSGGNATAIVFTQILDDGTTLPVTPGSSGLAYVVAGEAFTVSLAFVDKQGRQVPLSSSDTTRVTVYHGTTPLGYDDVLAGETTADVNASNIADAARDVRLTAVAETSPKPITSQSAPFDVLIDSKPLGNTAAVSVGGGAQGTAGDCDPTPALPVCGDLWANSDFDSSQSVLLSQGCLEKDACTSSPTYIQALAKFKDQELATLLPQPATLVMQCDKTVCGRGAIKNSGLFVTLSSDPSSEFFGIDVEAPACPAKGVVAYDPEGDYEDGNRPFCVDYVQSSRDIAGDTLLYLLFVVDAKVRFS